ncbi:1-acyl-sn-glycerol-3-phosphate acyltransferase [Jatrophihabitans sp. GAS493]|uniref:lysophospholipid acyltransferase family protein n=1 Tax=Jatrophihabitans sp. GAS493 TaxID=1907575 RepID=UPI000BB8F908|nr:lysophospholipid acyltransferase family protein [Jatrophihabitans sp. GAS493]SOD73992.1 1-acyl-sn-glycerol-3-phosphate acyltransferase [Jatrophihabitans sp. GAS493]
MLFQVLEYTLAPALRAIYQPDVVGFEYVPRTGPVIFAANHLSFADQVFTPLAARRQVLYFAKAEYFNTGGLRGRVTAAAFRQMGQVAVERDDPRAAAATIDEGAHLLSEGCALGIYPEGTRSPDGRLYKFRTGVARLALRTGAPVVPVALVGTREANPPGTNRWHRVPVSVRFGAPMDFSNRAEDERSSRMLRAVTDEVRACIQQMSGQNYVDTFASTAKLSPAAEQ